MRIGVLIENIKGMLYVYLLQTGLIWLVSIVVLYLGKMRLRRIE
jgi:hypothetical protein